MKRLSLGALCLAVVLPLGACIPVRLSQRCQKEISDCLANCPQPNPTFQVDSRPSVYTDNRTACEVKCHEMQRTCDSPRTAPSE